LAQFSFRSTAGDTRRARLTATWPEDVPEFGVTAGDPYPLSQAESIRFTAKFSESNDDTQAVVTKYYPGGGITVSGNLAYIDFDETDTDDFLNMVRPKKLVCDVQVRTPDDDLWTVAKGNWLIDPQTTRTP
jgi:hypothetical protein